MRFEELIIESQLDELNIGQGIGKVSTAIGTGVGNVQGAWQGARDAFTHARTQAAQNQRANTANGAPQRPGTALQRTASGNASSGKSTAQNTTATPAANAQTTTASSAPVDMKGPEIAAELAKTWSKATASQGSQTGAPQVRQQIIQIAKQAGMTGETIPEGKFYSKFLQMDI